MESGAAADGLYRCLVRMRRRLETMQFVHQNISKACEGQNFLLLTGWTGFDLTQGRWDNLQQLGSQLAPVPAQHPRIRWHLVAIHIKALSQQLRWSHLGGLASEAVFPWPVQRQASLHLLQRHLVVLG